MFKEFWEDYWTLAKDSWAFAKKHWIGMIIMMLICLLPSLIIWLWGRCENKKLERFYSEHKNLRWF